MAPGRHATRIGLLMLAAALLLGWLAVHTEIFYTDGLRYISQARTIDQGSLSKGLLHSVDHPIYPLAIVAIHRLRGRDNPRDWQTAAQLAAVISGVLLVIPLYLISLELFGASRAWIACLFIYVVPLNVHVLADALSESTFLLFWSDRGLVEPEIARARRGCSGLFPLFSHCAIAYLTRPEGLVILLVAGGDSSWCCRSGGRSNFRSSKARWALGLLIVGGIAAAGPFMLLKGGISSKPSMSRLLGLAPKADAMAVERERPLEEGQSDGEDRSGGDPGTRSCGFTRHDDPRAGACSARDSGRLHDVDRSTHVALSGNHAGTLRPGLDPRSHDGRLLHAETRDGACLDP